MAVVIETTLGDITVDLYLDQRPVTCLNFLKLCKMKYYNYNLFHSIRSGFIAQTGDPTGEGSGGQSIFGVLEGPSKRFFSGEKMPKIRHTNAGLLSMVCTGDMMVGSQFFFTLAPDLDSLDGVHCIIGEVSEGHDVLRQLNEVICDDSHRPYQDVRITHTVILEDPFNDPTGFRAPSRSPSPSAERLKGGRIAPDEELDETEGKTAEEVQEMIEEKEAKARATILEIVGDLPDADIAPPENVLFVCKLNPVTSDEDLEIIFSRFGKIVSCEVIRDKKTGDSLQYAFIEFSDKKSCEDAYFKMDNVLIDDRRIHVDFSQSVSKMRYLGKGRGVRYVDDNDTDYKNYNNKKYNHVNNKSSSSRNKDNASRRNNEHERNHVSKRNEYENRNNNKEKKHKSKRESNNHRIRSRSRSQPKRNRSRDRKYEKDNSKTQNNSKRSDRNTNDEHNHKHTENNSNSRQFKSPAREKSMSPVRRHRDDKKPPKENKQVSEKHIKKEKSSNSSRDIKETQDIQDKESKKRTPKRKREDSEPPRDNKKIKKQDHSDSERNLVPRTPTPIEKMHSEKKKKIKTKQRKLKKVTKKRRKYSTSSSESDSSSSSTSDSSTSSEDRRRRRRTRKCRRRHSSSSSSSDSSESSTSTSSSSESSTSSSSSNSEPRRRKRSKKVSHKKSRRK